MRRVGVIGDFYRGAGVNAKIAHATDTAVDTMKRLGAGARRLNLSHEEGEVYRAALGLEQALALRMRPPMEALLEA